MTAAAARAVRRSFRSSTRKKTAISAKVFAIPELLEAVLLELPLEDLLLVQRVNTNFRDVISRSVYLQRRLYFSHRDLPTPADLYKHCAFYPHPRTCPWPDINPFLDHLMHLHGLRGIKSVRVNVWKRACSGGPKEHAILMPVNKHIENVRLLKLDSSGSWRNMLVSNPPSKLYLRHFCKHGSTTCTTAFSHTRMGELFDAMIVHFGRMDSGDRSRLRAADVLFWPIRALGLSMTSMRFTWLKVVNEGRCETLP